MQFTYGTVQTGYKFNDKLVSHAFHTHKKYTRLHAWTRVDGLTHVISL